MSISDKAVLTKSEVQTRGAHPTVSSSHRETVFPYSYEAAKDCVSTYKELLLFAGKLYEITFCQQQLGLKP